MARTKLNKIPQIFNEFFNVILAKFNINLSNVYRIKQKIMKLHEISQNLMKSNKISQYNMA